MSDLTFRQRFRKAGISVMKYIAVMSVSTSIFEALYEILVVRTMTTDMQYVTRRFVDGTIGAYLIALMVCSAITGLSCFIVGDKSHD